jgi:excisionase family DNA binding protein
MERAGIEPQSPYDVLTAPEAAVVKGVHRNSVLKAIRKGYLQARKSGRSWIIDRLSLDRWEPRGHGRRQLRAVQTAEPPDPRVPEQTQADRKIHAQKLMRLLDQWMADESGHDEEMWPKLKAVLEQDRISSRPLFSETTE